MREFQPPKLDDFKPDLLLDRLVVSDSNRAALTAVCKLSQNPLPASGPLVLFGGQGLGKTHLVIGAALEMKRRRPLVNVLYIPTEIFVSFILSGIAAQKVFEFRQLCLRADVLMFDDYGQIERWPDADLPQHFSYVISQCCDRSKPVLLVDDQPPEELPRMYYYLKSSVRHGQIIEVRSTDYAMRVQILRSKALRMQLTVPEEVLEYLANRFVGNVRPLEAALSILDYVSKTEGLTLDKAMAERVLIALP